MSYNDLQGTRGKGDFLGRGCVIFIALFLMTAIPCLSEGSVDELRPVDFNGDGKPEKVNLIYSEPDDYGNCGAALQVESLGKKFKVSLKDGFNADTTYLKKLVLSDKIKPFIMVDAKMNNNKNRWVYSFDGHALKEELMVFSNFPAIEEKDVDHDGANEIVVKVRDDRPGRDPKKDSYERTYRWNGEKFYDSTDDQFKKEGSKAPSPPPKSDEEEFL